MTKVLGFGRGGALLAAAILASGAVRSVVPVFPVTRRRDDDPLRVPGIEPDNRGRRAEKDAIALAKAEAKRQRKAAKRVEK